MIPIRDTIKSRTFPFVTLALIGANILVFLHEISLPPDTMRQFAHTWGVVPARITGGRLGSPDTMQNYASLFTSMFLHGGWLHLLGNMWILWLFGDNIEDRFGHVRYLGFYVLCGVCSMLGHLALNPASTVPTLGASGAIAGVMGAYFLLFPLASIVVVIPIFFYPFFTEVPAVIFLLLWITMQVMSGAATLSEGSAQAGGVAFWAHVAGFAVGLAVAIVWRINNRHKHTVERRAFRSRR